MSLLHRVKQFYLQSPKNYGGYVSSLSSETGSANTASWISPMRDLEALSPAAQETLSRTLNRMSTWYILMLSSMPHLFNSASDNLGGTR